MLARQGGRGDPQPPESPGALRRRQGHGHERDGLAGDGPPLTEATTSPTVGSAVFDGDSASTSALCRKRLSVVLGYVSDAFGHPVRPRCLRHRTWPASGVSAPRTIRMVVILPALSGADGPERLPLGDVNETSRRGRPGRGCGRVSLGNSTPRPSHPGSHPDVRGLNSHLSSGPGRRRPAGGGTPRPPRVVQGRPDPGAWRRGCSATRLQGRFPGRMVPALRSSWRGGAAR